MGQAKNAVVKIETGRNFAAQQQMVDSGDRKVFTVTGGLIFSGKSGFEPEVLPNGIVTGYNLLSPGSANNEVDTAAFTANSKGVEQSPGADTATITRPVGNNSLINSITMASDGSIAVVAGSEGASAAFSETRGAAGGPPEIPVESVEIGQVRVNTSTAAVITSDQIKQVPGVHVEYANDPGFIINNIGEGNKATNPAKKNAFVEFYAELPTIHTGGVTKPVYISYYEPLLANVQISRDFVPAEETHTLSSEEFYGGQSIGSVAQALGQATFTVVLTDGVNDAIVAEKNEIITVQFFPDRLKSAYILQQGILGLGRTFPVDAQIQAAVTLSAEVVSAEFSN